MTTSKDILEAVAHGAGPRRVLVTLGYAAWGEGQLESELRENAWMTVAAKSDIIFNIAPEDRYAAALQELGLQPWMLHTEAGNA